MARKSEWPRLSQKKVGRPQKFRGPRRPVTVTLPERTLAQLASVNADRARAIVKVTDEAFPVDAKLIELLEVAPGLAIILVGPSQILPKIKWLRLVEVAPTRFLLTIPPGTPIDSLELSIMDLLEEREPLDDSERSILTRLRDLMRELRRRGQLLKAEMLFVDTKAIGAGVVPELASAKALMLAGLLHFGPVGTVALACW